MQEKVRMLRHAYLHALFCVIYLCIIFVDPRLSRTDLRGA